jgi:DNA-binding FadR family transcriptional regulator
MRAIERHEPAEAHHAMQVHVDASRDKMVKLFSA